MNNRGPSPAVLGVIATILACFATIFSGPPRVVSLFALSFILAYLFYRHTPKSVFFSISSLAIAVALFFGYEFLRAMVGGEEPPKPLNGLEVAYRDALRSYNLGDFDGTIEKLEPFIGTKGFEPKLVDQSHHLLGLAYLSLPQPRCEDTVRLLSSIGRPSLERSLYDKCKATSCKLCRGNLI